MESTEQTPLISNGGTNVQSPNEIYTTDSDTNLPKGNVSKRYPRLASLDLVDICVALYRQVANKPQLRGGSLFFMLIVNTSVDGAFSALHHSDFLARNNRITFADTIFPTFLFCCGKH